jgi:4-hydroxybenzoate polyprenyltransferase/phosphoserine phosphatase
MNVVPLVVDLDGTLLRSDLLHESALHLVSSRPADAWRIPVWLLRGKAHLKRRIAERVALDIDTLPFDERLLSWIAAERQGGRRIVLCSASDAEYVHQVADHLGIFDEVIASDGVENVSSEQKARRLVERFGRKGFDYAGDSWKDLPVWAAARHAVLVSVGSALRRAAARVSHVEVEFEARRAGLGSWLKALRLHQWAKNLLVFLPVLASHRLQWPALGHALLAFLAFGLCASSVYVVNDLIDLQSDRRHPRKRVRPFASGLLSPAAGIAMSALLLVAAFAVGAATLVAAFDIWLGLYFSLTLFYTLVLKRKILVDALALAALYTLRVLAGGAATGIWPGFWLLAFSMFLFLSLAFLKRYSEVADLLDQGQSSAHGRDYHSSDLPLVEMFGIASGFAAVVVLALYMNGDSILALYRHPELVWLTVPILLYWVTRMWVKAHRLEMHDDPVVFAMGDGLSLLTIGAFVAVLFVASLAW